MLDGVCVGLLCLRVGSELGMSTTQPSTVQDSLIGGTDIHSDVNVGQNGSRPDERGSATQRFVEPLHPADRLWPMDAGRARPEASQVQEPQASRRLIKRYSNRKLYDTHASRYVTLTQIAEMVGDGELVKVVDNKTREDKTEFTFAQVILEQLKSTTPGMARVKLAEIIRECQRTRPGAKPVTGAPAPVPDPVADDLVAWQTRMEDQLEQLPAAEAAAWRARLRDLNARLGELKQRTAQAGLPPHLRGSSLE